MRTAALIVGFLAVFIIFFSVVITHHRDAGWRATLRLIQDVEREAAPVFVCAWCPEFDPSDPANEGRSHGICPACESKFDGDPVRLRG